MPNPLIAFTVQTTAGRFEVLAASIAQAISSALYLAPRGARVITCLRGGDW